MDSSGWLILIVSILIFEFCFESVIEYLNARSRKQPVPFELEGIYSTEKYIQMQSYHSQIDAVGRLQSVLMFLISGFVLWFGVLGKISDWVYSISPNVWIQSLLFFGIIGFVMFLVGLPFSYYNTFVIEEKFGFNKTTKITFVLDIVKGFLVSVIIILPLSWLLLNLYDQFGLNFWWMAFIVLFSFSIVMSMFYTSFLLPIFNKLSPLPEGELKNEIEKYCLQNGFKLKNLFVMDGSKRSTKANAFFSGLGPQKSIVLFDTLVNNYSVHEIVAVLAHEVGHYKRKHTLQGLLMGAVLMFITFFVLSLFLENTQITEALGAKHHSVYLALIGFGMIYSPVSFITGMFGNILSRKNEYEADNFAKQTYDAQYLISALRKLSSDSFSNLTPHKLYVFFNYSHPALLQRINNLSK